MKKTFTKRILSIVLAMLMVITALPFTALTASAEATNIASQAKITHVNYNSNFNKIIDGRIGWDYNDDNYSENNITAINNTNSWNNRSNTNQECYANFEWTEAKTVSEVKVYFWTDGNDTRMPSTFKIKYSTDGSTFKEKTYTTHDSASFTTYVKNKTYYLSANDTLPNSSQLAAVVCSTFNSSDFINEPIVKMQFVSTQNGRYAVGLAEIEIFGEKYVAPPVDPAQQAQALKDAMTAFENKVTTGSNYKNIKAAYDAYVLAQKAYDAYVYGGDTTINLTNYANDLTTKTNKIEAWTAPEYNKTTPFANNLNASTTSDGYKNALYLVASNERCFNGVGSSGVWFNMFCHDGVYVYDGTNPQIPLMAITQFTSSSYRYVLGIYPSSALASGLTLKGNWRSKVTSDRNFNDVWNNYTASISTSYSTSQTGNYLYDIRNGYNNYKTYYNANIIDVNGATIFSNGEIYKPISLPSTWKMHDGGSTTDNWEESCTGVNPTLYVINYKPVKDYIKNNSNTLTNIADYSEGGASNVVNNFNNISGIDLSNITTSNIAYNTSNLSSAINNLTNNSSTQNNTYYAALRTAMDTSKSVYNEGNEDNKYTASSWSTFKSAYENAQAVMSTVLTSGYNNAFQAQNKAPALTNAFNALKLNITVKFVNAAGTTVSTKVYEEGTSASAITVPSNTTNKIETTKHTIYSWPVIKDLTKANYNNFADTTVTINEISNQGNHDYGMTEISPATCTNVQRVKYTCKVCEYNFETNGSGIVANNHIWDAGTHVEKTHIRCGYTHYVCTENSSHTKDVNDSDTSLADTSAYDSAVANANDIIKQPNKYSATTITALTEALEANALDDVNGNTQAEIDTKAFAIASVKITLKSLSVNIIYVNDEGNEIEREESKTVEYGNDITLTVPEKYSVIKWVRSNNAGDLKVAETSQSITVTVTADVIYNVTVNDLTTGSDAQNAVPVKLTNRIGKLVDAVYIPAGEYDVTVSKNIIKIGSYKLVAPSIVFYDFGEFRINGKPVNDGTYTFNSETIISTVYNPTASDIEIKCDDTCTANVANAYWDQKVVVTAVNGNENTQWKVNGIVVAYGPTYTFRASKDVSITCTTAQAVPTATATVLSLGYSTIREKTISAVCSYYVPAGYKFKEAGVLLKTSAVNGNDAISNRDYYTGENETTVNAKKFVASNFVTDTNQYVINVSSSKSYDSLFVGAVAYVTVTDMDGNNEQTIYSSLVTSEYTK